MSMTFKQDNVTWTNDPDTSVKMTIPNDHNLHEIFQDFRRFLLACGFSPESINTYVEPE